METEQSCKKKLTLVLGGGGALGALQVGALRALWEAGIRPDRLVGVSIGAINCVFMGLKGWSAATLEELGKYWQAIAHENPLPGNLVWTGFRFLANKPDPHIPGRLKELLAIHGLTSETRFSDMKIPLAVVASDLKRGTSVIFGKDPGDFVQEGILASSALQPWMMPIEKNGKALVDGALTSNLPIAAALETGAEKIMALDLAETIDMQGSYKGLAYIGRILSITISRQRVMEMALAEARGVPVQVIPLRQRDDITLWDFRQSAQLIDEGYEIMHKATADLH